jgi:hypothetical protein
VLAGIGFLGSENAFQMFWYDGKLNWLALLSIRSFTRFRGVTVTLFGYDRESDPHIPGCIWRDANDILPVGDLSEYKDNLGYAKASDLFRYKLLFKNGGWYFDTDCILVRPLDPLFDHRYVFGWQDRDLVANGILKFPARDPILNLMYEECTQIGPKKFKHGMLGKVGSKIPVARRYFVHDWITFGPAMLTRHLRKGGLIGQALSSEYFVPIHWTNIEAFRERFILNERTYVIHLYNAGLTKRKWKLNDLHRSLLELAGVEDNHEEPTRQGPYAN